MSKIMALQNAKQKADALGKVSEEVQNPLEKEYVAKLLAGVLRAQQTSSRSR